VFRQAWAPIVDEMLARSEQEARAGARIIIWPECGVEGFQEDEATLLGRVGALAESTGTYVDVGLCEVLQPPVGPYLARDESILIDPTGSVVSRFEKAHPVPGVENTTLPSDGQVQTMPTPYGRLASIVCYDGDYPAMLAPAARAGFDMLLNPGNDWREYDPYQTQLSTFRAIEQGYSLVRQSSHGLAMTVDYQGNVLASTDYFTSDPQVMVAYVPTRGVPTIYAMIGDLFAWLSAAALFVLIAVAFAPQRAAADGLMTESRAT
jgi:apolipoprotein N-acyltransferase